MTTADVVFPHSRCLACPAEFATRNESDAHMDATMPDAPGESGHRVLVVNPTRAEKDSRLIQNAVDEAVENCLNALDHLVYQGTLTSEQIQDELTGEWRDAWDKHTKEEA